MKKTLIAIILTCSSLVAASAIILPNVFVNKNVETDNKASDKVEEKVKLDDTKEEKTSEINTSTDSKALPEYQVKIGDVEELVNTKNTTTKSNVKEESKKENVEQVTKPEVNEPEVDQETENKSEIDEPKKEETVPEVSEPKVEQGNEQEPETDDSKEEEDIPEVKEPEVNPGTEQEPEIDDSKEEEDIPEVKEPEENQETEQEPEKDEPKEEESVPGVSDPEENQGTENEPQIDEPKKEDTPELSNPEVTPNIESNNEKQSSEETQPVDDNKVKNEELIKLLQDAAKRTQNTDSIYYTFELKGMYNSYYKRKYNKLQNRSWLLGDGVEEYLEGAAGRYNGESFVSSYYNQDRWIKSDDSKEWVKAPSLHSIFGIGTLSFFDEIKDVKEIKPESGRYAFSTYVVTIDNAYANKVAEVQYNILNMFKTDIKLDVCINHDGYIVLVHSDWTEEVLTNKSSELHVRLHMGNFNETNVERPKDLNVVLTEREQSKELTATEKREMASKIEEAYAKTRDVNSATYKLNGKVVKYNREQNSAIFETSQSETYYKGTPGMYVDHNYVGPSYHHKSWTKFTGTDTWVKNVTKHTIFTPVELYFLNRVFDIKDVSVDGDITTYTIVLYKADANLAYSHVFNESNKFDENITLTVSLDKDNYVREMHADFGDNSIDLVIYNIDNTEIIEPEGINE